jgi:hypothetical protein
MIKKTNITTETRMIVMIILVFSFLLACSVRRKSDTISKTYNISNLPYFKGNKKFIYFRDSIGIIYYKNYILYEFPHYLSSQNAGDTTSFRQWIKYGYFIYDKNDFYGRYYDSINSKIYKKMEVDSFLSHRAWRGQSIFKKSEDILISSNKSKGNHDLIEKYKCREKKDETYPDTIIVYYTNRMKEVEHTLSKELDADKKGKVKKIRAIYNPQVVKGFNVPRYEIMFELKEDTVTNLDKYKLFIEKHKK